MADWRKRVRYLFRRQENWQRSHPVDREDVLRFLKETAAPALQAVREELSEYDRTADVEIEPERVSIVVFRDGEEEFRYAIKARTYERLRFAFPEMTFDDDERDKYHVAEVYLDDTSQKSDVMGYSREDIIRNFLHEYDKRWRWQQPAKGRKR